MADRFGHLEGKEMQGGTLKQLKQLLGRLVFTLWQVNNKNSETLILVPVYILFEHNYVKKRTESKQL